MASTRLVAFGEAMVRLTTPADVSLETATSFQAPVGGAELNAAIAAVRSGMEATWVSTLPTGPLGDLVARHCRAGGVTPILRRVDGARLGLYFLEQATPPRASRIIYDRKGSAFALSPSPERAWADLLDADVCLLVTGITPALGSEARRAVDHALDSARTAGALVAVDVNYRAGLWSSSDAHAWLSEVVERVDVLSASPAELARLGVEGDQPYRAALDRLGLRAAIGTSKQVEGRRARIRVTAAVDGATSSVEVEAEVVDPVGAGDAVFGTFLASLDRRSLDEAVERSAGAAVSSYGVFGDALITDPWDLDENERVRR